MEDKRAIEDFTITLDQAVDYAKKWRQEEGTYSKHSEIHAFVIPLSDLQEVLAEDITAVRAYLGVDEYDNVKLMMVGTKYDPITQTYVDLLPGRSIGDNYIFDMTRPCPNACDNSSPLNLTNS